MPDPKIKTILKFVEFDFHMESLDFPGGSDRKESACSAGDLGSIPGLRRSPGEGMATHSSMLAWRIAWTAYSSWSCKELDMTE